MEKSLFFNSVDGDRKYNASDFASYFSAILTNGVMPQTGNLRVVTDEAFNLKVMKGMGNINGYLYQNDEDKIISIEPQISGTNRKDLIVLRLDLQNRKIGIEVKKDSSTLTREGMIYELCLAEISVKANATKITTEDINDTRFVESKCGLVSSLASINVDEFFDGDVAENVIKEINELKNIVSTKATSDGTLQIGLNAEKVGGNTLEEIYNNILTETYGFELLPTIGSGGGSYTNVPIKNYIEITFCGKNNFEIKFNGTSILNDDYGSSSRRVGTIRIFKNGMCYVANNRLYQSSSTPIEAYEVAEAIYYNASGGKKVTVTVKELNTITITGTSIYNEVKIWN